MQLTVSVFATDCEEYCEQTAIGIAFDTDQCGLLQCLYTNSGMKYKYNIKGIKLPQKNCNRHQKVSHEVPWVPDSLYIK